MSDLKVGDYVVHIDHGVALYQGLRPLVVEGASRDFMLLTFQEEAKLYVPLERLDLVEKFRAAGDGAKPALDRLGGTTWARTKSRVKRSLRDIAQELLRLYAERKMHPGTAYSADTPWQKELEDSFPFEETPDQISAMTDIKRDLESPQPMDRLLCGDVGYGKTELAMRAAFKVVQDGRQVARPRTHDRPGVSTLHDLPPALCAFPGAHRNAQPLPLARRTEKDRRGHRSRPAWTS